MMRLQHLQPGSRWGPPDLTVLKDVGKHRAVCHPQVVLILQALCVRFLCTFVCSLQSAAAG
jgi:hypothetical protein